jgi:hypothetical protein
VFFVLLAKGEKSSPFGELTRFASQKEKRKSKLLDNQGRKNQMTKSVYEIITEKIIEKLEKGVVPWRQLNRLYLEEDTLSNLMAYILFFNTYWNL